MDLWGWNQRLAQHFSTLARDRKDIPIFALEHGLTPAEVLALSNELRAHILVASPSSKHSLVWTAYAAEIGYRYAGDEFWKTFEENTPGWTLNGRRDWIRDAFAAFQKTFAGAKPSGPWAEQFSIIAWPITHAILPRDLQQQLARILYDLRHSFFAELFDEPRRLGDFIAAQSWNASARFRNLVQAPALVGQIAAALLLQGKGSFKPLLHPMTLKRIGDDVDRERRGRDWLSSARRAAEERAEIRLTVGRPTTATTFQRRDDAHAEIVRIGIEPRLVLRPIGDSRWEVSLEIPDLSHLLLRSQRVREVLTESRCTVAGAAGRPLARGRCLHGPQRVALRRWPRPDEVLLKFEQTDPELEYLLRAECLLRPGPCWLFKVTTDGLAYESRGMRVRAGSKYLLVSSEPFGPSAVARHIELACEHAHALLLDVPPALTPEWERALRHLQVARAKSIEVWPAGLAAVAWDGEGHGEWLESETPTLAIRSDHAVDKLSIAMGDDGASLTLTDAPVGEPIFVKLPPLQVGVHKVTVSARCTSDTDREVILDILIRIREARSWLPGVTACGPLDVDLDPAAPSLEQLWEAKAAVSVGGPVGRQVTCRVQMFARGGEASFERQLPPLALPISSDDWRRHFDTNIRKDEYAANAYDHAHVCEIEFAAGELGAFTIRCERAFTPLRWSLKKGSSGFLARLQDDADSGVPTIERYSFERPNLGEKLATCAEYSAPRVGGLYVAKLGELEAAIIVPALVKDLVELKCEPHIEATGSVTLESLLSLARLWGGARLPGDVIASHRRRLVLRVLMARVWRILGGSAWAQKEDEFSRGELGLRDLRCAIPRQMNPQLEAVAPPFEIFPQATLRTLADAELDTRGSAFVDFIARHQLATANREHGAVVVRPNVRGFVVRSPQDPPLWLAEFSLRMASDAATIEQWAAGRLQDGLKRLRADPTLACAARFLVLAVEHHQGSSITAATEMYSGWRWPS